MDASCTEREVGRHIWRLTVAQHARVYRKADCNFTRLYILTDFILFSLPISTVCPPPKVNLDLCAIAAFASRMYFGLRPELRGAQRILRSLVTVQRIRPSTRITTVRSFSSHLRLLKDPDTPERPTADDRVHTSSRAFDLRGNEDSKDSRGRQSLQRAVEREDAISRGDVPEGHSIARTPADLPQELDHVNKDGITFPAFYVDTPGYEDISPIRRIPKTFPGYEGYNKVDSGSMDSGRTLDQNNQGVASGDSSNVNSEASVSPGETPRAIRRRRQRRSKPILNEEEVEVDESEALPTWFVQGNIQVRHEKSPIQTTTHVEPEIQPTSNGTKDVRNPLPSTATQIVAEATGSSAPPIDDSSFVGTFTNKEEMLPIADARYYVHQNQYAEVFTILKGILQRSPEVTASQDINAMRHLALFHTAKDSDLLLEGLVKQLCADVDAAHVKVDVQDIAEFTFAAEPKPDVLVGVNKMSYGIYNSIYENREADPVESEAREEEDDEEDDHDEDDEGRGPFDFSSAVVALPMTGISALRMAGFGTKGADLSSLTNSLASKLSPDMPFKSRGSVEKIMDEYANLVVDAAIMKVKKEEAASRNEDETSKQKHSARPIVIQLPTYWSLKSYAASRDFRHSLIVAADRRSEDGQPIVVIGTDALRDLSFLSDKHGRSSDSTSTSQSQRILAEQGEKCGSATTAIIFTPCLPDKQAEAVFLQDRKTRIRDVNARHLYRAVKRKGMALKGLEDGFWTSDYSDSLGEKDCKALTQHVMRYLEVERLSSIIAGLDLSQTPITDAMETIKKSDESKVSWARDQSSISESTEASTPELKQRLRSDAISRIRSSANKHEQKLMTGVIEPRKINTTFNDIHIPSDTIDALQTLTSLSLEYPEAFKYGVLKSDRIPGLMLYGPPGTGKTLAAKAVAKESGATMLEVSAADLYDMYVGEGEKNIRALFSLARKLSPCVVFIDEADSLFSKRQERSTKSNHRELLNQFLKEWDGMSNDAGSAFIMVATNRPMDMDDAVLRRLPRRLLVDLPTETDRLEILKIHLRNETLAEEVNLPDLAKKTPFYSGSDLKNLAVAAALQVVREQHATAKLWQKEHPDSTETYKYPTTRTITQTHFDKALLEISASISEDMSSLKDIKKFDEQYGDRRGRKKKSPKWGFKSAAEADKVLDTIKIRS